MDNGTFYHIGYWVGYFVGIPLGLIVSLFGISVSTAGKIVGTALVVLITSPIWIRVVRRLRQSGELEDPFNRRSGRKRVR